MLYRRVDLFFVTSPKYDTQFLRGLNLIPDGKKVIYIPNASPEKYFKDFNRRRSENDMVVGYIGTFRGRSSILTLVEAAKCLILKGYKIRIIFAGVGIAKGLIKALSQKYAFIEYSGPYDYSRDIKKLYETVDIIYAVYDIDENKRIHLACRFIEAIYCGLPVLVSKGTYMDELVKTHKNGYSVDPNNPDDVAKAIEHLLNSDVRNEIREMCSQLKHDYLFEHFQGRLMQAYDGLAPK